MLSHVGIAFFLFREGGRIILHSIYTTVRLCSHLLMDISTSFKSFFHSYILFHLDKYLIKLNK